MRSLLEYDIEVRGLTLDTAIAAYLIDPAEARYTLPDLVEKYTAYARPSDDAAGSGQLDLDGTSLGDAELAARDALAVNALAGPIVASMEAQGMAELYRTIENPLVLVLAKMEHVGIGVDVEELRALGKRLADEVQALQAELREVAGRDDLNLNSPKQLREILYDERGLSPGKKTKTGYSTDAATLEKIKDQWPEFLGPLMRYREVEKLRSTYGEGLLAEVAADGRIHATFNQTVARTGRLSSDQPNLHNIPVRTEEGRQFRKAFVPAAGTTLLVADYNQIELRCIAHLAEGSRPDRRVHRGRGHPQRDRSAGVRRRADRGDGRAAVEGEDGLLRARLRHGGVRPRPAAEHPDRGSRGDPGRVLRGVPQREGLHGPHGDRSARARLHRDAVRAPPPDPRADELELPGPAGRRAPGDERRDPGSRCRHLQGRAGPTSTRRWWRAGSRVDSCCRCTTR